MMLSSEDQSIIKTLAHFDVLDYPLTLLELAKFNELGLPLDQILHALGHEPLSSLTDTRGGLYFLRGREGLVTLRQSRYRIALLKLKRARFYAELLARLPWIRAVAIYSSLSLKNSRTDGDIDLFFVTAADRAWSARFFLNTFLKFFGLRPTARHSRDRLCASYLADENHPDLSVANADTVTDYFYAYGCASFIFLAGSNDVEKSFWNANRWIKEILPDWQPAKALRKTNGSKFLSGLHKLLENIFGLVSENSYRDWQLKILPDKYSTQNDGKKVRLDRGIIKLHDNDKRGDYNRLFEENYERLAKYETQT